jgi:F-type H+-transporting ATPase subunit a
MGHKKKMPDFSTFFTTSKFRKSFVAAGFLAFFAVSAFANQDHSVSATAHEGDVADVAVTSHVADSSHEMAHSGEAHGASSHGEAHAPEKFAPGKMIMEHIADAHDWHLWGEGHESVSISLPVILYTESKGITLFSSARFEHGHAAYEGFELNEEGKVVWADAKNTESIYDISLSKNVVAMLIAVFTILIIAIGMANSYKKNKGKAPKGFHNLVEPLILFIRDDVAKPSIGHKTDKFMPLLLTIFSFIFVNNVFGLIPIFPGGANVTGNIAVTMVLALVIFLTVNLNGNKYYWKHIFLPDVPVWMYVIIIPIEILGVVLKPFVLMLRLFANITAGHIIILGFFSLIFIFGSMNQGLGYAVSPLSVAFTVFMGLLEMLVAFLQAFVFTLLSAIYIGMAVEEHHH